MRHVIAYGLLSIFGLSFIQARAEPQGDTAVVQPEAPNKKSESYYEKRAKQLQQQQQQNDAQHGKNYYAQRKNPRDHLTRISDPEQIPGAKKISGPDKKTGK
jgi:hypothetical protein